MQKIQGKTRQLWLPALLALVSFALYSVFSYFQYKHYVTPSWDLGIFTQLAKAYSHFDLPPVVEIKGAGFNLWGDHFHPILILLTPFYWLFPSPATLLYVQNGLVALSVFIVAAVAQKALNRLAAVLIALAYALSFGIQNAVYVQFHEVAFALPLLAASLGHIVLSRGAGNPTHHLKKAIWWAMPIAFVKEDMGVTAAIIGLVIIIRSGWLMQVRDILFPHASDFAPGTEPRFTQRLKEVATSWMRTPVILEATFLLFWGFAWSALAMKFILPLFNTSGVFDYADRVDLAGAIGDPLQGISQMFYPWQKASSLGLLLLAGVAVWLISPLALVALPTIAWRFLSTNEGYWESTWHYSLVLMPVVFLALTDVLAAIHKIAQRRDTEWTSQKHCRESRIFCTRVLAPLPTALPVLALLVALALTTTLPLAQLTHSNFATGEASSTDSNKQKVIDSIPNGSVVASDLSVLTYLIPNNTVYWIGHEGEPAPDYVIIDRAGTAWGGNPPKDPVAYAQERFNRTYQLKEQVGTIYVVQKTN